MEPGWELAVEAVLRRKRLCSCRTDDLQALLDALEDPAPASFAFILDTAGESGSEVQLPAGARPLSDFVRAEDAALAGSIGRWLRGVAAVDEIAAWLPGRGPRTRRHGGVAQGQLLTGIHADRLRRIARTARRHGAAARDRSAVGGAR
ncbi:MAG: hypothetical protein R3E33_02915 [Rhodocyclaceae bacterium]